MNTDDSPAVATAPANTRPTAITVICILGFIGALMTIPLIFTDLARSIGAWYPGYLGVSVIVGLVCMLGFWQMRKWAVFAYTALVAVNQVILFMTGLWNIFGLVIPLVVIAIGFAYLSKMR